MAKLVYVVQVKPILYNESQIERYRFSHNYRIEDVYITGNVGLAKMHSVHFKRFDLDNI